MGNFGGRDFRFILGGKEIRMEKMATRMVRWIFARCRLGFLVVGSQPELDGRKNFWARLEGRNFLVIIFSSGPVAMENCGPAWRLEFLATKRADFWTRIGGWMDLLPRIGKCGLRSQVRGQDWWTRKWPST